MTFTVINFPMLRSALCVVVLVVCLVASQCTAADLEVVAPATGAPDVDVPAPPPAPAPAPASVPANVPVDGTGTSGGGKGAKVVVIEGNTDEEEAEEAEEAEEEPVELEVQRDVKGATPDSLGTVGSNVGGEGGHSSGFSSSSGSSSRVAPGSTDSVPNGVPGNVPGSVPDGVPGGVGSRNPEVGEGVGPAAPRPGTSGVNPGGQGTSLNLGAGKDSGSGSGKDKDSSLSSVGIGTSSGGVGAGVGGIDIGSIPQDNSAPRTKTGKPGAQEGTQTKDASGGTSGNTDLLPAPLKSAAKDMNTQTTAHATSVHTLKSSTSTAAPTDTTQTSVTSTTDYPKGGSTAPGNPLLNLSKTVQPVDQKDGSVGSSSFVAFTVLVTLVVMAAAPAC